MVGIIIPSGCKRPPSTVGGRSFCALVVHIKLKTRVKTDLKEFDIIISVQCNHKKRRK
jgi:hypothetical protein